jgi:hypothetical protein
MKKSEEKTKKGLDKARFLWYYYVYHICYGILM